MVSMARRERQLIITYVGGLLLAGLLAGISYWLQPSPESLIIPFGLLAVSWLLAPVMDWSVRSAPKKKLSPHARARGPAESRTLVMSMPPTEARNAVEDLARTLSRARLVERLPWCVIFQVPGSWKFAAEELSFDIEPDTPGTHIRVSSRPLTAAPYGKNDANLDEAVAALERADQRYTSN